MDIALYSDFESIVRYGSISEAAKILHITQPALSRRMNTLEQELGVELFERTTPIQLTRAGEIVLEYACRINAEQYKLTQHVTRLRDKPITVVHITGLYSRIIGNAVRQVKNRIEDDCFFIDVKQDENLYSEPPLQLVREGRLQAAIDPYSPELEMDGLSSTPLLEEDICAIIASSNPLAKKGYFDGQDLSKMRFIFPRSEKSYGFYKHLRWLCTVNGLIADIPRSIIVSDTTDIHDILFSGMRDYAFICPRSMSELLSEGIGTDHVVIPFTGKHPRYDMRVFYSEDAGSCTMRFVEALEAALKQPAE